VRRSGIVLVTQDRRAAQAESRAKAGQPMPFLLAIGAWCTS
jgi:hypothetical protein